MPTGSEGGNAPSGGTVLSAVQPVTEDLTRVQGIIAGCGEAALLVILNGLKGVPTDPGTLGQIIKNAQAAGIAGIGTGGTATPAGLIHIASNYGVTLSSPSDWKTTVEQYAGSKPVIIGVSNARAFGGRDSNVFGHYITIVGKTPAGNYIVSDPNASSKFGKFDVYSPSQLAAAHPFWAAVPSGNAWGTVSASSLQLADKAGGTVTPGSGGATQPAQTLADWIKSSGLPGADQIAALVQASVPGLTDANALAAWISQNAGWIPGVQGITDWIKAHAKDIPGVSAIAGGLTDTQAVLSTLNSWINGANSWFNAQRILKVVFGVVLILIALYGIWNASDIGKGVNSAIGSTASKAAETAAIAA
jgi:hypothetical protein